MIAFNSVNNFAINFCLEAAAHFSVSINENCPVSDERSFSSSQIKVNRYHLLHKWMIETIRIDFNSEKPYVSI